MQAPTPFGSEIPEKIGPFRILRLLGVGGMGAVYLAERMEQFSQKVAIKILHPHLFPKVADAEIAREGQLLAALEHPGIVRMLDLDVSTSGLRYIVMEYVDGVPLGAYCDAQRLSIRRRMEILLDVFEAVEHAHRHLVVHADLKPDNILVTAEGKPRLLDFGVATILSELGASNSEPQEFNEGNYTALYASPEQRSGERLTVASDIYSLGLIAQSVLAGVQPELLPIGVLHSALPNRGAMTATDVKKLKSLDGNLLTEIATCRATTPDGLMTAIAGDVEAILAKALKLDPKERFHSAQEMRDEFERSLWGYPIHTRHAGRVTRVHKWVLRNRLAASLGFIFLLALLFSIVGVVRQATEAARKRQIAETRLRELVRLTDVLAGDLYGSLHGLQGSESAQAALLNSAHETINKLAAEDDQDAQLELELAREYEKLARLELSRTPLTQDAVRQSTDDLDKESGILQRIKGNDPEVRRIRERLSEAMQLRDAAMQRQGH
jgi:predicted Ser/Thr protein kinase